MELVDLSDSKSDASACGFESHLRHHKDNIGNYFLAVNPCAWVRFPLRHYGDE